MYTYTPYTCIVHIKIYWHLFLISMILLNYLLISLDDMLNLITGKSSLTHEYHLYPTTNPSVNFSLRSTKKVLKGENSLPFLLPPSWALCELLQYSACLPAGLPPHFALRFSFTSVLLDTNIKISESFGT